MNIKQILLISILAVLPLFSWAQVKTFHNLPYAKADRFQEAVMIDGWDKTADYSQRGPQCPQTPTSNEIYEPGKLPQSEDCLVLTINTPSMDAKLPVAVYVHGGSHHHGSGEWDLYDPVGLTEDEGIVTVNISFRHGLFGYLYDEERGDSDRGSRDIICALKWIQANISDFGGDPDMVTLFGQSSGAQSVVYVMSMLDEKLFKRAMVFSAPFGLTLKESKARNHAKKIDGYLEDMGVDRNTASSEQIVAAEQAYRDKFGGAMPFAPSDFKQMPKEFKCPVEDVLVAYQAHDASGYVQSFKKKELEEFGTGGDFCLTRIATGYVFGNGAKKYAKYLEKKGVNTTFATFSWYPQDGNLRASHGLEMGLLYGPEENYIGHDLMGSLTAEELREIRREFRKDIADFVREGRWESRFDLPEDVRRAK